MMSMMSTRASISAAADELGPLSPSPWDSMLSRRRSSLGLSALFGGAASSTEMTNEHGHRLSWTLTAPDEKSMFAAIAELNNVALSAAAATTTSSTTPSSFTSSSSASMSPPTSPSAMLDGGADGGASKTMLVPNQDMDMDLATMVERNSAMLTGASDPMLKPSINLIIKQNTAQSASAAAAAAAAAAARPLMVEIAPWALEAAAAEAAALVNDRKRSRDAYDSDDSAFSDSGSASPFSTADSNMEDMVTPARSAKKAKGIGAKRPRAPKPNSRAVLEAMPKPPPRGLKDPVKEQLYQNMDPEEARLEKNRTSAKECRLRKKEYVVNLESKVAEFESREVARAAELASVRAQLAQLQREHQNALAAVDRA